MPQPINYSLNVPDPTQAVLQGVQGGANMANAVTQSQWAKDDRALAQAQAVAAAQKQRALEKQLYEVSQNPTADKINQLVIQHPQLSESFKALHGQISDKEKMAAADSLSPIFSALQNGNSKVARELLTQQYDAANNSNDFKRATAINGLLAMDDKSLTASIGLRLSSLGGLDKFASQAETLAKTPEEVRKIGAEATKTGEEAKQVAPLAKAEIGYKAGQTAQGWSRLNLDRDKLASETAVKLKEIEAKHGELPAGTLKVVNEAADSAVKAGDKSRQAFDLADRFTAADASGGVRRGGLEWLKEAVGGQDEISAMRTDYKRLRNNAVISNLPKGSASDRDIEIAMAGFPGENANAQQISGFLRGMAKMAAIEEATENAKAEWAGAVKHLGKTSRDVEIMGVQVPKGTTFNDFVKKNSNRFGAETINRLETDKTSKSVDNLAAKYGGGQ